MTYCPSCGETLVVGASFCDTCGDPIEVPDEPPGSVRDGSGSSRDAAGESGTPSGGPAGEGETADRDTAAATREDRSIADDVEFDERHFASVRWSIEFLRGHPQFVGYFFVVGLGSVLFFIGRSFEPALLGQPRVTYAPWVWPVMAGVTLAQWAGIAGLQTSVPRALDGEPVDVGAAVRDGAAKLPSLVVVGLVWSVATFVGWLALILPALYVGPRLSLAVPAAAIEDDGPAAALERGWEAGAGQYWDLLGTFVLLAIAWFPLATVASGLGRSSPVLGGVVNALGLAVITPLFALLFAFYYLRS